MPFHSHHSHHRSHHSDTTPYISLDRHRCRGCKACVAACPKEVLGMIDLPFHRHAIITHPERCIGCKKCVQTCPEHALAARRSSKGE